MWWENFASMCVYAWRSAWFSGADSGWLRNHSIAMGTARNELQWGKLLWTHLWIDDMYCFAKKWRILSKFSCFAMEGSHRRLKRILRNSGGPSLLRGRLGVQVVVGNHTIDDSLWLHGWDATKRAQHGQGPIGVQMYASRTRRRLLTDMQYLRNSTPAVPVSQKTDMRSPHKPRPLFPVTGVHAGAPTRGVRTNQGVHTNNVCVKSREFRTKFVRISPEFL